MKTSALTGAALDWAVAKCEGLDPHIEPTFEGPVILVGAKPTDYFPSTNWAQGGPIIDKESLRISTNMGGGRTAQKTTWTDDGTASGQIRWFHGAGPTTLIAAMRCYVTYRLGTEVDIPEELK